MIRKVSSKTHRGREYPQFWLTDDGVATAFIEGIPYSVLLEKSRQVYPNNLMIHYFLEIAPKLSPEIFNILYAAFQSKGKLEPIDVFAILLAQHRAGMSDKTFKEAIGILKKYPIESKKFTESLQTVTKNIRHIKELII